MYLNITNDQTILKLRRSLKQGKEALVHIPPFSALSCEGVLIRSDAGKKLGYVVMCAPDEEKNISGGLIEIGLAQTKNVQSLSRLLPNIMRSLKLDTIFVASNDRKMLVELFHYPFDFNHVCQVHRLLPTQAMVDEDEELTLKPVKSFNYTLFGASNEADMFKTPLYNKNQVVDRFACKGKSGFVGYIASVSYGADEKRRALFPVVLPNRRRNGLGAAMTMLAASREQKGGRESLILIHPEDEIGLRLSTSLDTMRLFDILEVRPQFHEVPVKLVVVEE